MTPPYTFTERGPRTCPDCDVRWIGTDRECWVCGRECLTTTEKRRLKEVENLGHA